MNGPHDDTRSRAMQPRYPEIQVATSSRNPLTLVAEVRYAMRRAHLEPGEIHRFSDQALSQDEPERQVAVCQQWVRVDQPRH